MAIVRIVISIGYILAGFGCLYVVAIPLFSPHSIYPNPPEQWDLDSIFSILGFILVFILGILGYSILLFRSAFIQINANGILVGPIIKLFLMGMLLFIINLFHANPYFQTIGGILFLACIWVIW